VKNNGTVLHPRPRAAASAITNRFGKALGVRFTRENIDLLSHAHSAVTALRRSAKAIRGRGANIFTQWVGDPDALGSAVLLQAVLGSLGAKEVRILTGALGHPQNRNLVERCGIRLHDPNEGRLPRGLHCMVDTSPPLGRSNTGTVEPVTRFFFVADHHAEQADVEAACQATGVKEVKHAFVGLPVGSTSAFMAVLAAAFGVLEPLGAEGRAAAALGIYTDTSALLHGATPLDFRMFEILNRDRPTRDLVDELRDYRVSEAWYRYRAAAFARLETRGGVRIAPVGWVPEAERDVIAEVASELLRIEGTSIGIAIAVTERGTEVSVRADSRLLGSNPERIVRVVDHLLEYTFPGCSGFKYERRPPFRVEGGACVHHGESKQRMWTLEGGGEPDAEAVDEHCRGAARAMLAALEDMKFAMPEEIEGLL